MNKLGKQTLKISKVFREFRILIEMEGGQQKTLKREYLLEEEIQKIESTEENNQIDTQLLKNICDLANEIEPNSNLKAAANELKELCEKELQRR